MSMLEFYLSLDNLNAFSESPMTLQVGLKGRDGFVIVSDSLINTDIPERYKQKDYHVHHNETQEKIKIAPSGKIAVSCAWDMRAATELARAIIQGFSEENTPVDEHIRSIAIAEMKKPTWQDTESLILISEPQPFLFLLQCMKSKTVGEDDMCKIEGIPYYAFAGNRFLSPTFWVHRFYEIPGELAGINSLLHLGTQVIADAGVLSAYTVRGLEAVICDAQGIRRVPDDELIELFKASKNRTKRLAKELFS